MAASGSAIGARATKVALIGAGFIADYHLQILKKLAGVEVVALVDVERGRAEKLARKYGVARVLASIAELAALPAGATRPDVAHALVPPEQHAAVATELLNAGIGVFLEKPLATTSGDARKLIELAQARGLPLAVNHNNTFHPGFAALKRFVAAGKLGRVEHVMACLSVPLRQLVSRDFSHYMFRAPQNIVFEQATHPFSQIVELLGPATSATAVQSGRRELAPGMTFFDTWQIALQHERGTSTLLLSFGRDFAESFLRAIGQDGAVHVDLLRGHVTRSFKTAWPDFFDQLLVARAQRRALIRASFRGLVNYVASTLKFAERSDLFYVGMRDSIAAFHASLRGGAAYACDGAQGLAVVECCERATANVASAPATTTLLAPSGTTANESSERKGGEILVTGANGFIGTHVVARLLQDGERVRALVRKPKFVPDLLRHEQVALVAGDVTDPGALDAAVAGARAVIHLATGGGEAWSDFERGMVGGTQNVAHACARHGVKRLVFTSTIAAYYLGDGSERPVTEETPLDERPEKRSLYARGKIATEQWLEKFAREKQLELVIARPGFVVGGSGAPQHSGVGLWTKDTQVFGWGSGERPLPFVLVDDVADALVLALENPNAAGKSYNLVGDVLLTAREWIAALRDQLGRDFHFHAQSIPSWFAEEWFKYLVKLAIRKPGATAPSWRDFATRTAARSFDNARPKRELGWRPVADRAAFLAAALPKSEPPRAAPRSS